MEELLGRTKSKITKNKNGENVPNLEVTEVVLVHCNIANNNYQQKSLGYICSNKSFGHLFLKTFNSEFSYIEVWFTDQKSDPLEIEDKININLVSN